MRKKSKSFAIQSLRLCTVAIVLILLLIVPRTAIWAQEEKSSAFSITPAFSFAWYPYTHFYNEESTNTELNLNNFGMSAMMSLKLFDKVGAYLNLKIDEPNFSQLVDFAGYVSAYYFMIKFDYHAFGGTVSWTGYPPNPIPGGVYNFRNHWNRYSLLLRIDQLRLPSVLDFIYNFLSDIRLIGSYNLGAIGIGYARYEMPLEYRVLSSNELSNSGFALLKGESWGLSILWDTLSWNMERSDFIRKGLNGFMQYVWIYLDCFVGINGRGEATTWMSGVSNTDNIKPSYSIFKTNLGFQYRWDVGEKGRIGLAVGIEMLNEGISVSDYAINYESRHIGPALRVSTRW